MAVDIYRVLLRPIYSPLYSRTPLIRPPSESHWCGRIRGMVAREGFVCKQKALSSHKMWSYERDGRWWGWSFVRGSTVPPKRCLWCDCAIAPPKKLLSTQHLQWYCCYVSALSPSVSIETVYNAAKWPKEGENVKKIVYNETASQQRSSTPYAVPRQQSAAFQLCCTRQ